MNDFCRDLANNLKKSNIEHLLLGDLLEKVCADINRKNRINMPLFKIHVVKLNHNTVRKED